VTVLVDGSAYFFETGFRDIVLGYYRRKSVQEKYYGFYGMESRIKKKVFRGAEGGEKG